MKWAFVFTFCNWEGSKVQYALSSGLKLLGSTNDLTYCYSCITESIMVSEAFNGSNTLTVTENIFLGHYSYSVKNVSY